MASVMRKAATQKTKVLMTWGTDYKFVVIVQENQIRNQVGNTCTISVHLKLTSIFRFLICQIRVLKFTVFLNTCFYTLNNQSIQTVAIRVRRDHSTTSLLIVQSNMAVFRIRAAKRRSHVTASVAPYKKIHPCSKAKYGTILIEGSLSCDACCDTGHWL